MPDRKKVTVRGNLMSFPRVCSKCLSKENLTSFTTEWSDSVRIASIIAIILIYKKKQKAHTNN